MIQKFVILFLCVFQFFSLSAQAQSTTRAAQASVPASQYQGSQANRVNRLGLPVDPVLGYKNAQDVVFLPLSYDDLPDFIRADIQGILGQCPAGNASLSSINAYSYVSSMIRAQGLSPNYLVDFSAFAKAQKPTCESKLVCRQKACLLLTYDSYDYGQWRQGLRFFTEDWTMGSIQDSRVKSPLAILQIDAACTQSGATSTNLCPSYYIWTRGGLSNYAPPAP